MIVVDSFTCTSFLYSYFGKRSLLGLDIPSKLLFFVRRIREMLKSCKYCGRIHEAKAVCDPKRIAQEKRWANRKQTDALMFRRTNAWTNKSITIRARDN